MRMVPAAEGFGIRFKRVDLPNQPVIPASVDYILGTPRCTILGRDGCVIQSVEHILSALKAREIDNLLIELDGPEVPVGDGSALPFVEVLKKVDLRKQKGMVSPYYISEPIYWSGNGVYLVALPSKEFRISYTLSYPNHPLLHSQFYSYLFDVDTYAEEIAPSRTFSLYEEILPLLEGGVIKGGSLENGVVLRGKEVLNPGGLRFPDEMVRHKILDLIGDFSLIGTPIFAHIVAIRSGHYSNTSLAKEIAELIKKERKK
jgi:UDP-3-O-[3-hydroxymyristoyl] N-acetylglucosamine deacetylase